MRITGATVGIDFTRVFCCWYPKKDTLKGRMVDGFSLLVSFPQGPIPLLAFAEGSVDKLQRVKQYVTTCPMLDQEHRLNWTKLLSEIIPRSDNLNDYCVQSEVVIRSFCWNVVHQPFCIPKRHTIYQISPYARRTKKRRKG